MYKCKCCGSYTLPAPSDSAIAFICPVCYWENDVFLRSENVPSDENHGMTLIEAQKNYLEYGACREKYIKSTRTATLKEKYGNKPKP